MHRTEPPGGAWRTVIQESRRVEGAALRITGGASRRALKVGRRECELDGERRQHVRVGVRVDVDVEGFGGVDVGRWLPTGGGSKRQSNGIGVAGCNGRYHGGSSLAADYNGGGNSMLKQLDAAESVECADNYEGGEEAAVDESVAGGDRKTVPDGWCAQRGVKPGGSGVEREAAAERNRRDDGAVHGESDRDVGDASCREPRRAERGGGARADALRRCAAP